MHRASSVALRAVSILLCAAGSTVADEAPVEVALAGLRVVAPPTPSGGQELRAFNWDEGTGLALRVRRAGSLLVGIDPASTRLDRLSDDRGVDLRRAPTGDAAIRLGEIAQDGGLCLIEIVTGALPSAGSQRLNAAGVLGLRRARGSAKARSEPAKLVRGTAIRAGAASFEVVEAGMDAVVPERFGATLRVIGNDDHIRGFSVHDATGAEIRAERFRRAVPGASIADHLLIFPADPGLVTFTVLIWEGIETVVVPFALHADIGQVR